MYTVFILAAHTMEEFQAYYPLFEKAVETGEIGICQWMQEGTTLETAVPELNELIAGKRQWRAVIVSTRLPERSEAHPADEINPFDFLENAKRTGFDVENGQVVESPIPLIRLTHLLAGIPAPEPQFIPQIINEAGKPPRVEYQLDNGEAIQEMQQAFLRWSDENMMQGVSPTELILVQVRRSISMSATYSKIRSSWQNFQEIQSSRFWKRNLYPSITRFLVYDVDPRGAAQRTHDLFQLWAALLVLVQNPIDSDILQAHRLYKLRIELDREQLQQTCQEAVRRLNSAYYPLEKSQRRGVQEQAPDISGQMPEFGTRIPVSFQQPDTVGEGFRRSMFGLLGGAFSGDHDAWKGFTGETRSNLEQLIRAVDRTLDHAAYRVRERMFYPEEKVVQLTPYQLEDMRSAMDEVYHRVLDDQNRLHGTEKEDEDALQQADAAVMEELNRRVSPSQITALGITVAVCCLACVLPGLAAGGAVRTALLAALFCAAVCGAALVLRLAGQKQRLVELCRRYESAAQNRVGDLSRKADAYSEFLSDIASHLRGCSYLDQMQEKLVRRDETYYFKKKHLYQIENFKKKVYSWCCSQHLQLDMQAVDTDLLFDNEVNGVDFDKLYTLEDGKEYSVPLCDGGEYITSPYGFVKRLWIDREEVYDDGNDC